MRMLPRGLGLLIVILMSGCERSFIYYPERGPAARFEKLARAAGLEPWHDGHGQRIGWRSPPPAEGPPAPAVIVFHGNAGHAAQRSAYVAGLRAGSRQSWTVYLFEYPGYGSRPGEPGEAAILGAARDALSTVPVEVHPEVFLVGESLGSGVACAMAAARPERVAGLLLVTPFTSLRAVAEHHYPGWLVRLLLNERYDNEAALRTYTGPVGVVLAENDEVIPAELGRKLHAGYTGPKRLWLQAGRTHNTLSLDPAAAWWEEVAQFWQQPAKKMAGPVENGGASPTGG